jgi:hypothetical protein
MILLANQSWQDRVQEKFSIFYEMQISKCLRKNSKENRRYESKAFQHSPRTCDADRFRNGSNTGHWLSNERDPG